MSNGLGPADVMADLRHRFLRLEWFSLNPAVLVRFSLGSELQIINLVAEYNQESVWPGNAKLFHSVPYQVITSNPLPCRDLFSARLGITRLRLQRSRGRSPATCNDYLTSDPMGKTFIILALRFSSLFSLVFRSLS